MNAEQVAVILGDGTQLEGQYAGTCTSCHVPMKRMEGKLGYLYCDCRGGSPEIGHLLGYACQHPEHREGVICR